MTPLLLLKGVVSMKKEMVITLGALATLLLLPILALGSLASVGASSDPRATLYNGPTSTKNTYVYGYCTFWAAKRREDIGKPIPNSWGNANTSAERARAMGYTVDHAPTIDAIMQTTVGDLGHVAFVESVTPNGSWTVSEMNAPRWDVVSRRTFTANIAITYNFIH